MNIEVTGGGSDVPAGTLGEALYAETDPGILVNIYTTGLAYTIPGPALYSGGSGSVATSASAAVASSTAAPASITAVPTTMVTSVKPTSTAAVAVASAAAAAAAEEKDDACGM